MFNQTSIRTEPVFYWSIGHYVYFIHFVFATIQAQINAKLEVKYFNSNTGSVLINVGVSI